MHAELQLTGDGLVRYGDRLRGSGLDIVHRSQLVVAERGGAPACVACWSGKRRRRSRIWRSCARASHLYASFRCRRERAQAPGTCPRASRARRLVWQMSSQGDICNSGRWRCWMRKPRQILERSCFADAAHAPWSAAQFLEELSPSVAVPRSWWVAHDDGELRRLCGRYGRGA